MKYYWSLLLFSFLFSLGLNGQAYTGQMPTRIFDSENFGAQAKMWVFGEDNRGAIYVGNKEALLVYTGLWKKFPISNHSPVRSLAISKQGNIFVGGEGEFGMFIPNKNKRGDLIYKPLHLLLDTVNRSKLGFIESTTIVNSSVYFSTENSIYIYRNNSIKQINIPNNIGFRKLINNRFLIGIPNIGLFEITDERLKPIIITGEKSFCDSIGKEINIEGISNYKESKAIFFTSDNKLGIMDLSSNTITIKPFETQLDSFLVNKKIAQIIYLSRGLFAINVYANGIYIIDEKGRFIRRVNKNTGIKENIVLDMFLDKQGSLWLAHESGISKVSVFANYLFYPKSETGIEGRALDIARFNNLLFIGTTQYLYCLEKNNQDNIFDLNKFSSFQIKKVKFKKEVDIGCWDLLTVRIDGEKSLLFSTNDYIYQYKKDSSVAKILNSSAYTILQDSRDSNRLWVALFPKGLISLYYKNGKWENEGLIPETNFEIYFLVFDKNNNIWLGRKDGLSMLVKPIIKNESIINTEVVSFTNKTSGLPINDAIFPFNTGDEMIFGSSEGIFVFDSTQSIFKNTEKYTSWFTNHHAQRIIKDSLNNIWVVTYPLDHSKIYIKKLSKDSSGNYQISCPYAADKTAQQFDFLLQDGKQLWAGGSFDLVRIKDISLVDTNTQINLFINNVSSSNDTLFNGFSTINGELVNKQNKKTVIPYSENILKFQFSAITKKIEGFANYRWKLIGFNNNWTNWADKTEVQYINLYEGNYKFIVQAKDIYGNISKEQIFVFKIKPPWYRTIFAYFGFVLFFIVFVYIVVKISNRGLKRIITSATRQIQIQKNNIEAKNKSIISSIQYAKRLQEAVRPEKKLMKKAFPEHFVLWKPLDIVSGDFYWMKQVDNKYIIAAADCTGHGVPGAFMSIMGASFLNEIANNKKTSNAADILNLLRKKVINLLNQEGHEEDTKDGMDISLCIYDFNKMKMDFSGAYNSLYMIRNEELFVYKADRMPIGVHERDSIPFSNTSIDIKEGDIIYILSDGFIDQFGGPKGKKYMTKRFKELILKIHRKPMKEQKEMLWNTLLSWKGENEQVDDIIIIGIKVVL